MAGTATSAVNLRVGPGVSHDVLTTIPAGAGVAIHDCARRWCEVSFEGRRGFASRAYLSYSGTGVSENRRTLVPEIPRARARGTPPQLDTYDYAPSYRRGPRSRYSYRPYGYHGYRGFRARGGLGPPRLGDSVGLGSRSLR